MFEVKKEKRKKKTTYHAWKLSDPCYHGKYKRIKGENEIKFLYFVLFKPSKNCLYLYNQMSDCNGV